jgi:hypothetical protein
MPEHPTGPIYRFHGRTARRPGGKTEVFDAADVTVDAAERRGHDAALRPDRLVGRRVGRLGEGVREGDRRAPDDTSEIRLHINSPGGEVYEGLAILNQLRNHPARRVAVIDGLAASAASFIATGADEVVMGQNTQLMIHDAWGLCVGAAIDMRDMARPARQDQQQHRQRVRRQGRRVGRRLARRDARRDLVRRRRGRHRGARGPRRGRGSGPEAKNKFDLSVFATPAARTPPRRSCPRRRAGPKRRHLVRGVGQAQAPHDGARTASRFPSSTPPPTLRPEPPAGVSPCSREETTTWLRPSSLSSGPTSGLR